MAESMWWYSKDGQRLGPEPLTVLQDLVNTGVLQRDTLIWCDGMDDWLEARELESLAFLFDGPPPIPGQPPITPVQNSDDSEKHELERATLTDPFIGCHKDEHVGIHLTDDVRKKYLEALSERYKSIGSVSGFIIAFFIMLSTDVNVWVFVIVIVLGSGIGSVILGDIKKKYLKDKSDELIQVLYNEHLKKKHYTQLASTIVGGIFVVAVATIFILNEPARNKAKEFFGEISSSASCVLVAKSAYDNAFIISNKSDYGYTVKAEIKNNGEDGEVSIVVNLNTSEGDFQRKQKIQLSAGETKTLFYQFSEPTLNVTNVRYRVRCSP